jgi:hypothetical protein
MANRSDNHLVNCEDPVATKSEVRLLFQKVCMTEN